MGSLVKVKDICTLKKHKAAVFKATKIAPLKITTVSQDKNCVIWDLYDGRAMTSFTVGELMSDVCFIPNDYLITSAGKLAD